MTRPAASGTRARTTLRTRGQVTLPSEVRDALGIQEGDDIEFTVDRNGHVTLLGLKLIPADQAWFWTREWQKGEQEASAQIAQGRYETYKSGDDFLDGLKS
jgi:AbrB family looped-hinge helix DNA binding protein